jgi:hypothetical protein
MRTFLLAVTITLLTVPAYSQGTSGGKRHHGEQKTEAQKKKPDDKAYNSALRSLPDRPYDPWREVR